MRGVPELGGVKEAEAGLSGIVVIHRPIWVGRHPEPPRRVVPLAKQVLHRGVQVNIDLAECARRGLPVGHTPDVLTESTADIAFGLLLAGAPRA